MKVSDEGVGILAVGLAVDSLIGGKRILIVGPGIQALALIVGDIREGVVEVSEERSRTAGNHILDVVAAISAPLREIADKAVPMALFPTFMALGEQRGRSEQERESKTKGNSRSGPLPDGEIH